MPTFCLSITYFQRGDNLLFVSVSDFSMDFEMAGSAQGHALFCLDDKAVHAPHKNRLYVKLFELGDSMVEL